MGYVFQGIEPEGYYNILTGRPRYPATDYNIVRQETVNRRKKSALFQETFPAKPLFSFVGAKFKVPALSRFTKTALDQKRYAQTHFPAII